MITKREVVTCVILTIVTCGIYGLYWVAKINNDTKILANDNTMPSGGTVILLSIVTCGIYSLYWAYKMGQLQYEAQKAKNVAEPKDNAIIFLVLAIVFPIVGWVLMQNTINDLAK